MEKTNEKYGVYIDGELIAECTQRISLPVTSKRKATLYMKRGNKFYFKVAEGKLVAEFRNPPKELLELKYGDVVDARWTV